MKGIEPWFASGSLFANSQGEGLAQRQIVAETLPQELQPVDFAQTNPEEDGLGVPDDENIRSTYWRKKTKIPHDLNPDRDQCGVVWLCLLFPFDGQQIVEALEVIASTIKLYQFEPNLGMNCISARTVRLFIAIMYDREVSESDTQAMDCHDQLLEWLLAAGYIPDRLGIQSMNSLPPTQDDYAQFMSSLKQNLDPENILAPGRYDCF